MIYTFTSTVWRHPSTNGWYFAQLPKKLAKEIRDALKGEEEGWGRLKTRARIGESEWRTAIWFDTKMDTYLLPIKADIRKQERIVDGGSVEVVLIV
jgi:hypothetical protein